MPGLLTYVLDHEPAFKSQARLASLYSDFALTKASNPDGYTANASAWVNAIQKASRAGLTPGDGILSFSAGSTLANALELEGLGRPLALGAVVSDAVANKDFVSRKSFLDDMTSIYYKPWINIQALIPTPRDLTIWGLRQIGFGGSQDRLPEGDFVILKNVEEAADKALALVSTNATTATSLIYSLSTFTDAFSRVLQTQPLSKSDIDILLVHLVRDKHAVTTSTSPDGSCTIKFASPRSTKPPLPINHHDETIATLLSLNLQLTSQINALHMRVTLLDNEARNAVAESKRTRALSSLRLKKLAEATLKKRGYSQIQVENVLTSIDEAAGQVEMVDAMEASGKVLLELNKQIGGIARVDKVMDAVREAMEESKDVGRVLAEIGAEDAAVDDTEVDEELAVLTREQETKVKRKEEAERIANESYLERQNLETLESAPDIPNNLPARAQVDEQAGEIEKRLGAFTLGGT